MDTQTATIVILRDFVYPLIAGTAVIWAPILCMWLGWEWWLEYVRKAKIAEAKFSMIEIKVPKETFKSPAAIEAILNSMYGDTKPPLFTDGIETKWSTLVSDFGKWYDAVWVGKWPLWWSLEIASIEGNIYFFIRCEPKNKETIENLIYAQFPQAEVTEVDDYTKYVPSYKGGNGWEFQGAEYVLKEVFIPDPKNDKDRAIVNYGLPIKTYVDYGLHDSFQLEEDQKIDPMVPFLQAIGSVGQGEQVWFQIVLQGSWKHFENPEPDEKKRKEKPLVTWQDVGRYYVDNIILRPWRGVLIQGKEGQSEKKDAEGKVIQKEVAAVEAVYNTGQKDVPDREKPKLEAIERNLAKSGYDCGIRLAYIAKSERFNKNKFGEIKNSLKQFNAPDRNSLDAVNQTDDGFDYPWSDYRDLKKITNREKMFKRFVKREFFYPKEMGATVAVKETLDKPLVKATIGKPKATVLTTEELATIFHFPGSVAQTSALARIEAKKAEAPANLPI